MTLWGALVNMGLTVFKLLAGIFGRSAAMVADGIHSLSDLLSDAVVLIFTHISSKGNDKGHSFGHGKFETFATMLISFALLAVAVGLFWSSAELILRAIQGETLPRPGILPFVMAVVSVGAKEWLFQYTRRVGMRISSMALVANAWHHRSDAFSSIAVLVGIGCAMFLGEPWRVLDPIAALIVSVFIVIVSLRIGLPSINELLEVSLPDNINKEIGDTIQRVDGVKKFHRLRTRKNGSVVVMSFHVKVDPTMTIVEAHNVASRLERVLREKYGAGTIINVHVEPYFDASEQHQSVEKY